MPGRQSHGVPPKRLANSKKSSKKDNTRSLRAYEIAVEENPVKIKDSQHRLNQSEAGRRSGKRSRDEEESDDDEEDEGLNAKNSRRNSKKGRFDGLDAEAGSDSEGNEWVIGQVASGDDSDLDSDEAFGESDEERFEDFTFGGSSKKGKSSRKNRAAKGLTLDEDEEGNSSDEDSDESLGEDAIDLVQAWDDYENDMDVDGKDESQFSSEDIDIDTKNRGQSDSNSDESEDGSDDQESLFSRGSSEEADPAKLAALENLIDTLPDATNSSKALKRREGANEFKNPSDFGIVSSNKLTLDDLGLPFVQDPHIKKSLKYIESISKPNRKIRGKLDVPLARREQDKLDRDAAYVKTKETLDRWTDTVKHNRRADHLQFPLPDPDAASVFQNSKLLPNSGLKPFSDLEAAIQKINEESGFGNSDGKDEEGKIQEFEELEAKKMSLEEVKIRRDQLRANRELLFREEAKAKRIKKIKSKSYRRVHRKQREKDERMNREALEEAGVEPSEDEIELQDRRRAAERMGSRHRGSKWAKSTKESGRAAWDEDARTGVADMARRDEELRKRIEGKTSRRNEEDNSDISESESEDGDSSFDGDDDQRMRDRLDRLDAMKSGAETSGSKLANMKFMKNAEAARKKENEEAIRQLKRELAGEESDSAKEDVNNVGRRTFGPGDTKVKAASKTKKRNEFEEPSDSEEDEVVITTQAPNSTPFKSKKNLLSKSSEKLSHREAQKHALAVAEDNMEGGAWSRQPAVPDGPRKSKKGAPKAEMEELDLSQAVVMKKPVKVFKKTTLNKSSMLAVDDEDSNSESDNNSGLPFAIRDQELIKRAFAGADVVGEFEREKQQTIQDEEEKVVDNALPGWGSWAGEGISKKERNKKKGQFLTKLDGIKADKRKDAKLQKVIINEKRIKKNTKYLASSLPHPFETREQYERSLRLPVGPEWSTKETFQDSTKPRVLLKQGIVAPMVKPLI